MKINGYEINPRANLQYANLLDANLQYANLRSANLQYADLRSATLPDYSICPEEGSFIGWKSLSGHKIAKLQIPTKAKRTSSLVGRKCRAEFVKVLEIQARYQPEITYKSGTSPLRSPTEALNYEVGECVIADKFDDDIRVECTHGIHFFITRKEAEEF